jgi:hypothetical protein
MKTCNKCLASKPDAAFSRNGKYLRSHCKECRATYEADWRKNSPGFAEKNRQQYRDWYYKDPLRTKALKARWTAANKAATNAKTARRKAREMKATPLWADREKIEEFYFAADFLGMVTGEWYHVDHSVPMQSEIVCGLHTEQNLQVLPASDNLRKSNRRWPDMP